MNSWAELVENTSKVILPISAEFQEDFSGNKRVITVNPCNSEVPELQLYPCVNLYNAFTSKKISLKLCGHKQLRSLDLCYQHLKILAFIVNVC